MSVFTFAISCLTTFNLPGFMDLTFQVPMQYYSLQHQTLLPSPVTSTTGCCFCFGSVSSFFLELFILWSPVAYWAPINLGSSSFSVLSFFAFSYCSWGSHGKNTEVVCHSLLQQTTFCQNSPPWPSWVALHEMAWSLKWAREWGSYTSLVFWPSYMLSPRDHNQDPSGLMKPIFSFPGWTRLRITQPSSVGNASSSPAHHSRPTCNPLHLPAVSSKAETTILWMTHLHIL